MILNSATEKHVPTKQFKMRKQISSHIALLIRDQQTSLTFKLIWKWAAYKENTDLISCLHPLV